MIASVYCFERCCSFLDYSIANARATFFNNKLDAFKRYIENLGIIGKTGIPGTFFTETEVQHHYIYTPDLLAKKNKKIHVVEVKTNTGVNYLKGEKLKGFMLARKYGFIPTLLTLNIGIKATDLMVNECLAE